MLSPSPKGSASACGSAVFAEKSVSPETRMLGVHVKKGGFSGGAYPVLVGGHVGTGSSSATEPRLLLPNRTSPHAKRKKERKAGLSFL
ncbi:HMA domain-containing protein [Psidium guajava]|nr:HMA domain-containing protein [Psidium guajava]